MEQKKLSWIRQASPVISAVALILTIFTLLTLPLTFSKYIAAGASNASARVAKWEPVWLYRNIYGNTKPGLWDRGLAIAKSATATVTSGNQVFTVENKSEVTLDAICWVAFLTPADAEYLAPSSATPGAKKLNYADGGYQDYGFNNYIQKMNTQDPLAPYDSTKLSTDPYNVKWQWFNDHKEPYITMAAMNYSGGALTPATSGTLAWWLNLPNDAAGLALANRCQSTLQTRAAGAEYNNTWRFRIEPGKIGVIQIIFNGSPSIDSMADNTGHMCKLFIKAVQVD